MLGNTNSPLFFLSLSLFTLISISASWDVQSPLDESRQCAELFFKPSFKGPSLQLNTDEQFSDLSDIQYYLRKQSEKQQTSQSNETEEDVPKQASETGTSFRVRDGCFLTLATQAYMKGATHEFSADVDKTGEHLANPKSAACECPKECTCEEQKLRHSECARAYLHDDCTHCKALFTSLRPGANWNNFPRKWASEVKSIILRDGCDVSIRHGSGTEKFSSSSSKVIEDFTKYGGITRYQCTCSESMPTPDSRPTDHAQNYPLLMNIPQTKGQINSLLSREELKGHKGLLASLQSMRSKRSSKNAYILLLGLTGSGKSTAVNLLFDHPNITKTGDFVSTTKDILEFTVPVPVHELGLNNTALHVIDTPGIGDTTGLAEDARFLASLDELLSNHKDLKRNLPNVVLIFAKFSDNRFGGEGSSFVKMLRTIDLFKDKIIDRKSTNVIFVLTHYMSVKKDITRDPSQRVEDIREVIQQYSSLPRPIHIILAENKPDDAHLPSVNGFYRLPNGEFYPKNLFDQMQRNLVNNGDPIGEAIIRTAFSNSDNFKISGIRQELLHPANRKVTKYLGTLGSFTKRMADTDISGELNKAYSLVDPSLKTKYPEMLQILQRSLFVRNILHLEDLPQSDAEVLRLFQEIPINPVSLFLLQTAFNMTVPEYGKGFVVGSGYSLIRDETLPSQIFNVGESNGEPSDILFAVPNAYVVAPENQLVNQIQVFTNREQFIEGRMKSLGLAEDAIPAESYNSSLLAHPGYNLISLSDSNSDSPTSPQISWDTLSATVDYHTFQVALSQNANFSDDFSNTLTLLQPLKLMEPENVRNWSRFFNRYGTHVVTHAYGGGSIAIAVKIEEDGSNSPMSDTDKFAYLSEIMANIIQQLANELIGKDAAYEPPPGINYEFSQVGGNRKHYWSNFSELDEVRNIDEWKESLKYDPVVLKNKLLLLPISEVVTELTGNRDLAYMIEEAAAQLLNASLVYIPMQRAYDSDGNPVSRDGMEGMGGMASGDFESMQRFADMFKAISESNKHSQEQLITLMAESKRKQQLEEERYEQQMLQQKQQQAEDARRQAEEDRLNREFQLKREEMLETRRILEQNAIAESNKQAQEQFAALLADSQRREQLEEERYERHMLQLRADRDSQAQRAREDERYRQEVELKKEELEHNRFLMEQASVKSEMEQRVRLEEIRAKAEVERLAKQEEIRAKSEHDMLTFINLENQRQHQMEIQNRGFFEKIADVGLKLVSSVGQKLLGLGGDKKE